jgi:signal transduction histidine kinase
MMPSDGMFQELSPSEATATLINLAKLAQRAGSASGHVLKSLTQEMLQHVVVACHAQQGAILLSTMNDILAEQSGYFAKQVNSSRLLALHEMREEEVASLLMMFRPLTRTMMQATVAQSAWMLFTQPLIQKEERQYVYVFLLLGWKELEQRASLARGQRMLPLLGDAIASAMITIVQAEQLYECERALRGTIPVTMNLFKTEVLATVSHELRSPLTTIKGYTATLLRHERRLLREERRQFLLAIHEGTERLERIVNRLLEVSQLEADEVMLATMPIDMLPLVREAMSVAKDGLSAQRAGRFTFGLVIEDSAGNPAEGGPLVEGDPRLLREVLDNLLENAINYSPEGGAITVVVRPFGTSGPLIPGQSAPGHSTQEHEEGRMRRPMLELDVQDTGIGIAPEHIGHIFERFYRADLRLTREVSGLGLGLAICKRIVELHGGAIWAESLPGGGSTFHVLLPLASSSEA